MANSNASTRDRKPAPLRRALLFSLSATTLIPLLVLAAIVLLYLAEQTTRDAASKNQLVARAISSQIKIFLQAPETSLMNLSALYESHRHELNPSTFQEILDSQTESASLLESIYVLNRNGQVVDVGIPHRNHELRSEFLQMSLGHQNFIQQAKSSGTPKWSNTFLSLITGNTTLALAVPSQDRILVGNISLDLIHKFLKEIHRDDKIETTIVDRHGEIIACSSKTPLMCPPNLWNLDLVRNAKLHAEQTETYSYAGRDILGSVSLIDGPDWIVLVAQTSQKAYQPVRQTSLLFISIFLAAFVSVTLVVILMSKRISKPLHQFSQQALLLADGQYDALEQTPLYVETAILSEAFQHMSERIEERQAALQKSESAYRTLTENLPAIVYRLHIHDGYRLQFMNDEHLQMTGYSAADYDPQSCCPFEPYLHPDDRLDFQATIQGAINSNNPFAQEYRFLHANGEYRTFFEKGSPVYADDSNISHIDGIIFDVTDRKNAEEIILQSEKMLTVGGLAAGMAHEINNPLAGILQNCQLIFQRIDIQHNKNKEIAETTGIDLGRLNIYLENRKVPAMLEAIKDSGQRAAKIVENILDFSRKGREDFVSHDIPELINKAIELSNSSFDLQRDFDFKSIEINCEYEDNLPEVQCDPAQIQQVLLNLFKNSAQAMSENKNNSPQIVVRSYSRHEMICIDIEDNGPGITPQDQKRIFEPFFTTKKVGKGTGLGLSVCYFIITEKHQGSMAVKSIMGKGTTFSICLPRATKIEQAIPSSL